MNINNKPLTITDIAITAGVSKTTISRYLNGKYEFMSKKTYNRIKAVIEMTGYQPNSIARSLKNQKSMLVGLVIADIESPFSSAAIKSIGNAMLGTEYNIITANCDNSYEREQKYIQSLLMQQVDGLIVNTTAMNNPFLINLANGGLPIVLLDRFVNNYKFDIAYYENQKPIFDAVDHLMLSGYSRAAFFTQPYQDVSPRFLRWSSFKEKLTKLGESNPEKYVYVVDNSNLQSLRDAVKNLLESCKKESAPPAIIAGNGVTLMCLVQAIRSLGLSMPNDIGLCGYDDWGWATELGWVEMVDVGLTTITPSTTQLGEITAKMLLDRMNGSDIPRQEIAVSTHLIIRGSTKLKK